MFLLKTGCYNSSTAICSVKINDFPEYIFTDKNDTFTVNTTNTNLVTVTVKYGKPDIPASMGEKLLAMLIYLIDALTSIQKGYIQIPFEYEYSFLLVQNNNSDLLITVKPSEAFAHQIDIALKSPNCHIEQQSKETTVNFKAIHHIMQKQFVCSLILSFILLLFLGIICFRTANWTVIRLTGCIFVFLLGLIICWKVKWNKTICKLKSAYPPKGEET